MNSLSGRRSYSNLKKFSGLHIYFFILIVFSFLIRIYFASNLEGFVSDQEYFVNWMDNIGKYGLSDVYGYGFVNYPPVFLALLGIYREVLSALNLQAVVGDVLIRLPSILFDMAAIVVFAIASKRIGNPFIRAILVTLLALNPAVLIDGSIWGQIDMLHGILMVCSILVLVSNPVLSGIIYAVALLAKFQSIVIAPIFAVFFLKKIWEEREFNHCLKYILGFCIPLVIFGGYFAINGTFYTMLKQAYLIAVGTYPNVTLNAMNIWYYAIGTDPNTLDTTMILPYLNLKSVGLLLLFVAVALTCLYIFFNRRNSTIVLLKASTFLCFAFFMLPTEMHERYSFPALVFVLFVLLYDIKWIGIALGLTVTIFLNLVMVLYVNQNVNMGMFLVFLNCIILYSMGKLLLKEYSNSRYLLIEYNNKQM